MSFPTRFNAATPPSRPILGRGWGKTQGRTIGPKAEVETPSPDAVRKKTETTPLADLPAK
jgi:hypothetical protein